MNASRKKIWAHRLFFPAAALYAAFALPYLVFVVVRVVEPGPQLFSAYQLHAFEMLFGFALAVVAGYTLGPLAPGRLSLLFLLWLAARASQLHQPFGIAAILLNIAFPLLLGWHVVPRFFAAKKWRNRVLLPVLTGLCLLPVLALGLRLGYSSAPLIERAANEALIRHEAVLFFALLLAFMGGRLLAPAIAGEFQRLGREMEARVQPSLEGALIVVLLVAAPALAIPRLERVAGLAIAFGGVLLAVRILRWQPWHLIERFDLVGLVAGYSWLALGLMVLGLEIFRGPQLVAGIHLITVGALGTITSGVMARIHYQRRDRRPTPEGLAIFMMVTMGLASLLRWAGATIMPHVGILLAAFFWSLCFAFLALVLLRDIPWPTRNNRGGA